MEVRHSSHRPVPVIAWSRFLRMGSIAVIAATATNLLVYAVASAIGAMPQDVYVRPGQPITLVAVAGTTISAVILAMVVFALLFRFTSRPLRWFLLIAAVVLVLSFVTPFAVPGAPMLMIVVLELMHIATALITVFLVTKVTKVAE